MPYDLSDPRSSLVSAALAVPARPTFPPQSFAFGDLPPDEADSEGGATWWVRSQSCVVAYTRAETGSLLTRKGQVDEYVLIVGPDSDVSISTDHGDQRVSEAAVVVMPPGASAVTAHGPCVLGRVFTAQSTDLTRKCKNAVMFEHDTDPNVAPYEPWPLPPAGYKLRVYPLAEVPVQPGRFGRIFRCSTVMINMLPVDDGPRDTTKLSPHSHDDLSRSRSNSRVITSTTCAPRGPRTWMSGETTNICCVPARQSL